MGESLLMAKYITGTTYDDISGKAVDTAKKSFLDTLGVILAAGTLGEGCKEFVDLAVAGGGKKESTILGFSEKVPAYMAAFANGAMSHALDFEDAHDRALVHANAATIPAALAVAESIGNVSGKEFITAIILGSDVVCRMGLAIKENPFDYGWYMPPILGAFGAATAVSKLLGLNDKQILDAFSLTLCQVSCSAELTYSPHSLVRAVRDAFSAKAGVLSAMLAQKGISGFDRPMEGKAGFYNLYTRGNYDPAVLTGELGSTFESAEISFKPWPGCRGTHSYIDAVMQILKEHKFSMSEVEGIKVVVSPVNKMLCEPLENKRNPQTTIDAKFSLPFVIATALLYGRVALEHFTPQALLNQDVLDVARKVSYEVDYNLTIKEAIKGALEINLKQKTISKRVVLPYGHPENPLGQDDLVAKFMDCAGYSFNKIAGEKLNKVVELTLNMENIENLTLITELLSAQN